MPQYGYDIEEDDIRFINQSYYEEFEDSAKLTRQIKNYVEGYWDSIDRIRTRVYLFRNDQEFAKNANEAYRQFIVK